MCDGKDNSVACDGSSRHRLRLVNQNLEKQKPTQLSEADTNEMHELFEELRRKAPREKTAENDPLPPAA